MLNSERSLLKSGVAWLCLGAALVLLLLLVVPGLNWGLPSAARNRLALGDDPERWQAPEVGADEASEPWEFYPNYLRGGGERKGRLPRSAFNPIRSYHPDEYVILKSLSGMRPFQLKVFHGFFGWPAFHFYVVGVALKVCSLFGAVSLVQDVAFYFRNPEQMARLYLVGRVVTLLFAIGCVVTAWACAGSLFGTKAAAATALLLVATPLFSVNAHYLTADIPMLFWISLTLLASIRILNGGRRRWYVWAGVFLGLAAGTRYQGGLAAFLIASAHVLRERGMEAETPGAAGRWRPFVARFKSRDLWLAAAVSLLVFLVVNPYVVVRPGQFCREVFGEWHSSRNPSCDPAGVLLFVEAAVGFLFAAATLGALWMAFVRRERHVLFILAGLGIPAVLLGLGWPVMVRYMMPVLLLPVLLVSWAFGLIHRRGMELGKLRRKLAAPILLAVLLLFTAHQSLAYCRLFVDPQADTRTRAGEWIVNNIPAGSTLGVVSEPWQFELPPLNRERFRIRIIPVDPKALSTAAPDYVVSSDLQFPPLAVRGPLDPGEEDFRREVFEGGKRYAVVTRFEAWPWGRRKLLARGPHDMRYVNPVIVIARRKGHRPPSPTDGR